MAVFWDLRFEGPHSSSLRGVFLGAENLLNNECRHRVR